MKAIIFLIFIVLVFLIIRFTLNRVIEIRDKQRAENQKIQHTNKDKPSSEAMVKCAQCGIHLPQSSAYYDGKDTFCSEGHMKTFQDKTFD